MKYTWLNLLRKITLICIICLLVFSTTSCTNNQTTSPEIEITQTPSPTDNSTVNELPPAVKSAVLSDATKRVSKPVASLRITQVEKQNWGDSCLGLAEADQLCAQVIVPGWKVVVTDGQRELVYRTDEKGKQVKLEDLQT
ncbi:hypothetical protein IQ247_24965 [Plectonema cf. radiosum LEGE 06105]|uniref:Lipoprotein n=1 Tax=Plectonema cf. radiosum LEGE 06105 TaxID=945769 RepID=A0A8J7FGF5_9CYAN|nr:hypothetical protein [Plectonema radiosum]MBE9215873.1 hypothetical protein [Plectonema cf. radiosum LEGE 06105]